VQPEYVPDLKGAFDTSNFDANFTKELVREDTATKCAYNLELTVYDYLPEDFQEAVWYSNGPPVPVQAALAPPQAPQLTQVVVIEGSD